MSELDKLKKPKLKGYLTNFDFSVEGAHLALTNPSQGGAASLKNVPYLTKAVKDLTKAVKETDLDDEQKQILIDIGEEFAPLSKSVESTPSPDDSADSDGEDVNKNKDGKNVDMTDKVIEKSEREIELEKQLRALNKSLVTNTIKSYGLSEEVSEGLTEVLVDLDGANKDVVTKALTELVDKNKELKSEKADIEKSAEIEKEVTTEKGAEDDLSQELDDKPLTFKQKVEQARLVQNKESK